MDTIFAVNPSHIEVKATERNVVTTKLDQWTRFITGRALATLADVRVEKRVVLRLACDADNPTVRVARLPGER